MSKVDEATDALRSLPPERGEAVAAMLLALVGDGEPYQLTPEELADIADSDAAAARGDFATDEQVRAIWAKHGL